MFGYKTALAAMLAFTAVSAASLPAVSGDRVKLKTPEASLEVLKGNKLLKAGDSQIKVKPGQRGDCVRMKAGDLKLAKGKIKNGKCKS